MVGGVENLIPGMLMSRRGMAPGLKGGPILRSIVSTGLTLPPGPTSVSVTSDPAVNPTTALTPSWVPAANPSGLTTDHQEIDQSTTGGASWTTVDHALASGATSKIVGSLSNTDTHRFRIRSVFSDASVSAWSVVVALDTPLTFSGSPSADPTALRLDYTSNETGANYLLCDGSGTTITSLEIMSNTTDITGLMADTSYDFLLAQQNASTHTGLFAATTVKTFAATPTGLAVTPVSSSEIDGTVDAMAFDGEWERSLDDSTWDAAVPILATATSFADTGRTADTEYFYRIRYTGAHLSDWSAVVNATTLPVSGADIEFSLTGFALPNPSLVIA